ncbi:MAG: FkbM family methyltransferase [Desulfotignum sp.]|nr:FkbM family methyltransferase [Desulfotignum sp.]MCF8088742.1 FkbM family methyltransferase [Desulfotignum sp.]MCF8138067.1 FkbM family methyltransferase [Desulfotignum sp.]
MFYSDFIKPGMLCFDIGANIGNRAKVFLKLGAAVVAVEPQNTCMKVLERHYGRNPRVTLVHKAVGAAQGVQEMMIASEHTLSSLSKTWVAQVRKTGRFSESSWEGKQEVTLTTLDHLIEIHGVPDFIKIDVEGYEHEVVKGLTRPVNLLSLEFTPEYVDSTINCINHLSGLGPVQCNWSKNESMAMVLGGWVDAHDMIALLDSYRHESFFGDVYVQFAGKDS